jgi:hypothetical protein
MKTLKRVSFVVSTALAFAVLLTSCETNPEITPQKDILPEKLSVDIPASISYNTIPGGRKSGRSKADSLKGNDIYLHLGTFIAVGEAASQLVEEIITGLRIHKIDRVLSMTFNGDDHRTKNLVVESNVSFEGKLWDYQLTITDADTQGNADGGKALQVFWNKSTVIKGISIIKPYNCDRIKNAGAKDAMFRINYSEESDLGYDAEMEVLISGLPLESPLNNPYSMSTLRMFAGKKGEIVDVFGNSNHPNAILFSGTAGFNWTFVASGNDTKEAGVAEVGLPPSALESSDRKVLLKDYSIKNVFTTEITAAWPGINQTLLANYLKNTAAPGYFNNGGFISGGTSPGEQWNILAARLENLKPYSPKSITTLSVTFK